jgi:phosphate/sulfate permease
MSHKRHAGAIGLNIYLVSESLARMIKAKALPPQLDVHILSSGIAGTMVANGSGIQKDTVRNIILAWVLTLPVCVLLGAALFGAGLFFVLHVIGVH